MHARFFFQKVCVLEFSTHKQGRCPSTRAAARRLLLAVSGGKVEGTKSTSVTRIVPNPTRDAARAPGWVTLDHRGRMETRAGSMDRASEPAALFLFLAGVPANKSVLDQHIIKNSKYTP